MGRPSCFPRFALFPPTDIRPAKLSTRSRTTEKSWFSWATQFTPRTCSSMLRRSRLNSTSTKSSLRFSGSGCLQMRRKTATWSLSLTCTSRASGTCGKMEIATVGSRCPTRMTQPNIDEPRWGHDRVFPRRMTAAGFVDWAVFWTVVAIALVADIVVARLGGRTPTVRNAALWSGAWIGLGLLFGAFVAVHLGGDAGITYLTAYLLEKSLSVDNLFLFVLIFAQTGIPAPLQHRALFWGIVSALIMRAVLIGLGLFLLERFHWVIYPFAGLLVFAAVRMLFGEEEEKRLVESSCALCTSWVGRFIPIAPFTTGTGFLVREGGRLLATPLLVALVVIETTDLFLVYTSNVFALLGLRSLYFVLAGTIRKLRFLRIGLGILLLFVAAKMLLADVIEIPSLVSFAVIAGIFGVAIVASRLFPGATPGAAAEAPVACTHRDQIRDLRPETDKCAECVRSGDRWIALRMCLSCGNVACCDSSKNQNATKHFDATGHPIMRSIEPGENWKWCYVDRVMVDW